MPVKRRNRIGSRAQTESDSGVSSQGEGDILQNQKRDKIELFLKDFVQQGKQRAAEIKREVEALVSTAEKVCALELLKMPLAIRKMKLTDFVGTTGVKQAAVVCAAIEFHRMGGSWTLIYDIRSLSKESAVCLDDTLDTKPLKKSNSRVKIGPMVGQLESEPKTRGMSTASKNRTVQRVAKPKLVASTALKNSKQMNAQPRSTFTTPVAKSGKKVTKSNTIGVTPQHSKRLPRMTPTGSRCISSGGEPLFMDGGIPFVNIPLAGGQSLCYAGDELKNVDVTLLNNAAVQSIHKLVTQLTLLCGKAAATAPP